MYNGMGLPDQLNEDQLFQILNSYGANPYSSQANSALGQEYGAYKGAFGALQAGEGAALDNYDQQTGQARNSALGALNARGLTNSLLGTNLGGGTPISGQGSGALQNLALQRLMGRNQLMQGYTNEANNLNNSLLSGTYDLGNAYAGLGLANQKLTAQEDSQQPNPLGLASLALSLF